MTVAIFPFKRSLIPLALSLREKYKVVVLLPHTSSLIGKDIGYYLNRSLGILIRDFSAVDFRELDVLYIDSDMVSPYVMSILKQSCKAKSVPFVDIRKEPNILSEKCEKVASNLFMLNRKFTDEFAFKSVMVSGLYPSIYTGLFSVLIQNCIPGSVIVTTNPDFRAVKDTVIVDDCLVECKGYQFFDIRMLNLRLKSVEMQMKPYIIFDVPGGMIRRNEYYDNGFGMPLWTAVQTLQPDLFFHITPVDVWSTSYFELAGNYLSNKLDMEQICFVRNNQVNTFYDRVIPDLGSPDYRECAPMISEESKWSRSI